MVTKDSLASSEFGVIIEVVKSSPDQSAAPTSMVSFLLRHRVFFFLLIANILFNYKAV
jgi:hypothetical protein